MADGTYTYEPANIREPGKDRMRFELGDTMVEGGPDTSALTDIEIETAIELYPESWKRAKLMLLESLRRFSYEPDTKTGPLELKLQERAKMWRDDYNTLKKEIAVGSCPAPVYGYSNKPPYFYVGMQQNKRRF